MSSSTDGPKNSDSVPDSTVPRAIIHKKILDAATSRPDVSIEELADDISAASVDLVEQVLDEYGDPAKQESGKALGADSENSETSAETQRDDEVITPADQNPSEIPGIRNVSKRQREILHKIHEQPDATQAELAEQFQVSPATINKQVNSISGFDWDNRQEFVESMVKHGNLQQKQNAESQQEVSEQVSELAKQVQTLEERFAEQPRFRDVILEDPCTVHKVVHACMESNYISEEEELQILKAILTYPKKTD